jgi:methyl-accepting chemotaxis protein
MTLTVGKKLLVNSLIAATLTVAVGIAGFWGVRSMSGAAERMMKEEGAIGEHASRVRANTLDLRRYEKDLFINIEDAKKVAEYEQKFGEQGDHLQKRIETLQQAATKPQDRERVAQMATDFGVYMTAMKAVLAKIKAGQITTTGNANRAIAEHKDAIHRLEATATEFSREAYVRMAEAQVGLAGKAQTTLWTVSVFSLLGVASSVALGLLISRSIANPLGAMAGTLKEIIEERDLTRRLSITSGDEIGEVARWFNSFMDTLHGTMTEVKQSSVSVASASKELAAAAEQISSGVQEQAASLEETASSMEEFSGTIKQSADNARQATQVAAASRETADKGGRVAAGAVDSMREINQSSGKIVEIISVIDEIAFQTNLLALNAAVEAARAGDQGRGFAVVAAEVRNLAQRSSGAAKEIKSLIQDSVQRVHAGSEQVNQSGQNLQEIVTSVTRVHDLIAEIAAANQEQAQGIEQVNKAVGQMDQVTQSNAAQTEELASTAGALAGQAQQLESVVARFKLDHSRAADVPASPASATRSPVASATPFRAAPKRLTKAPEDAPAMVHVGNGSGRGAGGFEEF